MRRRFPVGQPGAAPAGPPAVCACPPAAAAGTHARTHARAHAWAHARTRPWTHARTGPTRDPRQTHAGPTADPRRTHAGPTRDPRRTHAGPTRDPRPPGGPVASAHHHIPARCSGGRGGPQGPRRQGGRRGRSLLSIASHRRVLTALKPRVGKRFPCPGQPAWGDSEDFASGQWQKRVAASARWGRGAEGVRTGGLTPARGKYRDAFSQQLVSSEKVNKARKAVNMAFSRTNRVKPT